LNFKYSTLEKATNSFDEDNKLGQGGFGAVYKVNFSSTDLHPHHIFYISKPLLTFFYYREFCLMEERLLLRDYISTTGIEQRISTMKST